MAPPFPSYPILPHPFLPSSSLPSPPLPSFPSLCCPFLPIPSHPSAPLSLTDPTRRTQPYPSLPPPSLLNCTTRSCTPSKSHANIPTAKSVPKPHAGAYATGAARQYAKLKTRMKATCVIGTGACFTRIQLLMLVASSETCEAILDGVASGEWRVASCRVVE